MSDQKRKEVSYVAGRVKAGVATTSETKRLAEYLAHSLRYAELAENGIFGV